MQKTQLAFKKASGRKSPAGGRNLNLLLLSTGFEGYADKVSALYGASPEHPKTILYVAYALKDEADAAARWAERLMPIGIKIIPAHSVKDPIAALDKVDGVFISGGNTFRLIDRLQKTGLGKAIAKKVKKGMPYMGSSAGTNVACPTMMTTNDMPIVAPKSFDAMGLVPFQINAHYFEGDFYYDDSDGKRVPYAGETRTDRIIEYHEENATPVVGLREGSALLIRGKKVELLGGKPAKVFRRGKAPVDIATGKGLESLMKPSPAKRVARPKSAK